MCTYIAHSQNSFYRFRTVVILATFGLLTVSGFMVSINMPTAEWIRDQTVIIVKRDDLLSKLHTSHRYVGIVHKSITEPINGSAYALCSMVCVEQCFEAFVYVCNDSNLLNLLTLFLYIGLSFWLCVKYHMSYLQETCENQWTTPDYEYGAHECQVKIELYCNLRW